MNVLASQGLGWDAKMFREEASALPRVRGLLAPPSSNLAPLKNVGGMCKVRARFAPMPFVDVALEALMADPLPRDVSLPNWRQIPDSAKYARHVAYMVKHSVLRKVLDPDDGGRRWGGPYFPVWKDAVGARAVFSLKSTNKMSVGPEVRFSLLSSQGLIRELRKRDFVRLGLRFVHADITNAYYNYAVGPDLGKACCVRVGNSLYEALVASMGFRKHCGNSQALVWGALLRQTAADIAEGEKGKLGVPDSVFGLSEAPGFIELDDGGFIVLVYDSILIASTQPLEWEKRIQRNFGKDEGVNLMLKYLIVEGAVATFGYCGLELSLDGHGVHWRMEEAALKTWKEVIQRPIVSSPRALFRLLGMLRFAAPILNWPRRRLGRFTKYQSQLGVILNWDEESAVHDEMIEKMSSAIMEIENKRVHAKSHIPLKRKDPMTVYVAVDATQKKWAMWPMMDGMVIESECKEGNFLDIEGKIMTLPISYMEGIAFREAVRYLKSLGAVIWIIGNDNQGVGRAFVNGFSRSTEVDEVVALEPIGNEVCMIVADIPTDLNLSDIGTRPNKSYSPEDREKRRKATWALMGEAFTRWRSMAEEYVRRPEDVAEDHLELTYALDFIEDPM